MISRHSNFLFLNLLTTALLLPAVFSFGGVPGDQAFTYNALGRLTTSSEGTYSHDAAGYLLTITGPPPTKPSVPTPDSGTSRIGRPPTLGRTAAQNATGLTLYYSTSSNLFGARLAQIEEQLFSK